MSGLKCQPAFPNASPPVWGAFVYAGDSQETHLAPLVLRGPGREWRASARNTASRVKKGRLPLSHEMPVIGLSFVAPERGSSQADHG